MDTTQENNRVEKDGYIVSIPKNLGINLEQLDQYQRHERRMLRKRKIIHAAYVDIFVCILFAIVKFVIGIVSNSLAIESDAVSSLTESYSSIVTILGIKLAHKKPTKKHPNGFGRIEFITAIIGGVFVIVAGWHYFESSIGRIITPEVTNVTTAQLIIIAVTILGKLYLYHDNKEVGTKYQSSGLLTASRNAFLSCLATLLVIVGAVVYQRFHIDIDGYIGVLISIFMIFTGIVGIKNGLSPLLGKPVSVETDAVISDLILKQKDVLGVYEIRVIDNGAGIIRGTANVEMPSNIEAKTVYESLRKARREIYLNLGIDMTLGLITVNFCEADIYPVYEKIKNEILMIKGIQSIHGFNWNQQDNTVDIHAIVDYKDIGNPDIEKKIIEVVRNFIPKAKVLVDMSVNFSERNPDKAEACVIGCD